MRSGWLPIVVLGLAALTEAESRGPAADEKDLVIEGTPISKELKGLKTGNSTHEEVGLAFAIGQGSGKSKAALLVPAAAP